MNARQLEQIADVRRRLKSGEARALRLAVGISLAECAQAAHVSITTVWRYEHGERSPRTAQALAYSRVLARLERAAEQ